ncbi:uncharacterized protein LOC128617087 [Ictalurus furcatus]|uniref:uncharacterized protein LOC128617087 n=1 Tax=Ictalurus furcatus TaxID=66913 RepID=UPI002350FF7E|nr:uncharacterized protein LOC128617087 [Ictalurus furcatus]
MSIVSLLLSADEDSLELQMVLLELEDVEKQSRDLLDKQAQLLERRTALETSCASAYTSKVSTQRGITTPSPSMPCVSLCRDRAPKTFPAEVSVTPAPTHHGPWVHQQRKARAIPWARASPPPVFKIPTRNRFAPLRQTRANAVIVGDSIVRNVRVASTKGCFVLMVCTPAASERNCCQTTSPRHYTQGAAYPCLLEDNEAEQHRRDSSLHSPKNRGEQPVVYVFVERVKRWDADFD